MNRKASVLFLISIFCIVALPAEEEKRVDVEIERLVKLLKSEDPKILGEVERDTYNLSFENEDKVVRALSIGLSDNSPTVRKNAATCLAGIAAGSPKPSPAISITLPGLRKLLTDESPQVRMAAVWAMTCARQEMKALKPTILNELNSKKEEDRERALEVLQNMGRHAVEFMPQLKEIQKKDESEYAKKQAALIIGFLEEKAAILMPASIKNLSNDSVNVRLSAVEILGGLGPMAKEAIPDLEKLKDDKDERVRLAVAKALLEIQESEPKESIPKK